jgi:heterodisulfide reductase subunit A
MRQPEEATEKAKDLVRMGIAKASLLEPLEEVETQVTPSALVIGGGVVGMNAALNLAEQGFEVWLVEKEKQLGGILLHVHKLFTTDEEASKLIGPLIQKVKNHSQIKTYLSTKVKSVSGFIGDFDATLDQNGRESNVKVGTIIVAIGAEELKPAGQYGYGKFPNVMTQLELEQRMKRGELNMQNVVIINCVGARVPERTYCSGFCCMTAVKNATLIKQSSPEARVWVLHRDLMAYGVEFENYYRKSMEQGVRFIRYGLEKPPQVTGDGKAEKVKVWHQLRGREVELPADMVVLTTPLVPRVDNEGISKMLKVPLSEQGFFLEAHLKLRPVEFATDGIYICGSARWPTDIADGISQAQAAAAKAAIPLRRGYVRVEAITSFVNESVCAGCGNCALVCPFNAIEVQSRDGERVAKVTAVKCKGCGSCVAVCPSGAMQQNGFTDQQVVGMLDALVGRGVF